MDKDNKVKVILVGHVDAGKTALHAAMIATLVDKGIEVVQFPDKPKRGELSEVLKEEFEKTKREVIPLKVIDPEQLYGFEPSGGKERRRGRRAKERKNKK